MEDSDTIRVGDRLTDGSFVDVTVERVESGGFGIVAMGPDRIHGERVALKTIKRDMLARSPRVRDLFVNEALTWVGLWPHNNLVLASSVTEIHGLPFLVLDYAERGSLKDILGNGNRLSREWGVTWAQQIAAGLDSLHTPDPARLRPHPLVHGDLKPGNVLIHALHSALITDLGLVRAAVEGNTTIWEEAGTPAYMASEQWERGAAVGPPADIYALGLMLSEMFTGRHPLLDHHQPHSRDAWRQAHLHQAPRALHAQSLGLPAAMDDLYQMALSKDPGVRPTAGEALAALHDIARAIGEPPYVVRDIAPQTTENEATYWLNWAVAHERFKLHAAALERSDRALGYARPTSPLLPSILQLRADVLDELGRTEEALRACDVAQAALSSRDPRRALAWITRAKILMRMGRHTEADAAYAEALRLTPQGSDIWNNRAVNEWLWAESEQRAVRMPSAREHMSRAIQHVEQALALDPRNPRYFQLLAALRESSNAMTGE